MLLTFKKITKCDKGTRFLYVLDYLDMKFTVSENRARKHIKVFAGWKRDSNDMIHIDDFIKQKYSLLPKRVTRDRPTFEESVTQEFRAICNYIEQLYGVPVEYIVEDHMNILIEQWLEEA